jgi:hypothetical protein
MAYLSGNHKLEKEICDALGLKNVRKLDIHFGVNGAATVEAEMYLEEDGVRKLPAILKKFTLVPECAKTTVIGDEVKSFVPSEGEVIIQPLTFHIDAINTASLTRILRSNKFRKDMKDLLR